MTEREWIGEVGRRNTMNLEDLEDLRYETRPIDGDTIETEHPKLRHDAIE